MYLFRHRLCHLSYKNEDLSSIPGTHIKTKTRHDCIGYLSAREVEAEESLEFTSLFELSISRPIRYFVWATEVDCTQG